MYVKARLLTSLIVLSVYSLLMVSPFKNQMCAKNQTKISTVTGHAVLFGLLIEAIVVVTS